MNKILAVAGVILAITALALSPILPSAEAMIVSLNDTDAGVKIRCGVTNNDKLRCDIRAKDRINDIEILFPDGTSPTKGFDCSKTASTRVELQDGNYLYFINDCKDPFSGTASFNVIVENGVVVDITIA